MAMRISGHKTRSVFERYNITSEADLHDAAAKLNASSVVQVAMKRTVPTPWQPENRLRGQGQPCQRSPVYLDPISLSLL